MGSLIPLVLVCPQVQLHISFISPSHLHIHLLLYLLVFLHHVFLHGCPIGQINSWVWNWNLSSFFTLIKVKPLILLVFFYNSFSFTIFKHSNDVYEHNFHLFHRGCKISQNNRHENNVSAKEKNQGNLHIEIPSMDPSNLASNHQPVVDQGVNMHEIPLFFQQCK